MASPTRVSNDEILSELDVALSNRPKYKETLKSRIDSLVVIASLTDRSHVGDLYMTIADEYTTLNYDSTRQYYKRARLVYDEIGNKEMASLAHALEGTMLATIGAFPEGMKVFTSNEKFLLSDSVKSVYYMGGVFFLQSVLQLYPEKSGLRKEYSRRMLNFVDSIRVYSPENSSTRHYANALRYEADGRKSLMVAELNDVLDIADSSDQLYGPAASKLGDYYASESDMDEAVYYYAIAAINALKSCEFTAYALHHLGLLLNKSGDYNRSLDYLTASFKEAVASENKMRSMNTADVFPIIDKTYRDRQDRVIKALWIVGIILGVSLIVIILLIFSLYRLRSQYRSLRHSLDVANYQKVNNVTQFLTLSSTYIERFEDFNRTARRKIKAGQIDDLYNMINSSKATEKHVKEFLTIFDKTFLHIFPDFVARVNSLLRDDSQVESDGDETLNAELRILAFLRLGVNDSGRIAKFMGLSVNTIYTYRNKMRGRAVSRETFEQNLMRIEAV